jgi:two-component system, OmpR family, catabolic regulation response regulator CreB
MHSQFKKITILIVDDEPSIIETINYVLVSEGFEVLQSTTGRDALKILSENPPSLIILDVGLPDMTGFDVCKAIRKKSALPIIFLTARTEEVDRVLGLELGGDDYVSKPFSPRELLARVKAILRRSTEEQHEIKIAGSNPAKDYVIDIEKMKIFYKTNQLELSRYEFRILCLLIKRPGKVFSRDEIMNKVWETPEMSLERTIDTHIKTIRSKLSAVDPTSQQIVTHRGLGYSLKESQ